MIGALNWLERNGILIVTKCVGMSNRFTINLELVDQMVRDPSVCRTRAAAAPVRQTDYTRTADAPPPVREAHGTRAAAALRTTTTSNGHHHTNA